MPWTIEPATALSFFCPCGGMADTTDLKSVEEIRTGSNPVMGTSGNATRKCILTVERG